MMPIVPSAVIISRQVIAASSRRIMRFPPRPHAAASAVAKRCLMAPTAAAAGPLGAAGAASSVTSDGALFRMS
jgi:hypothetical protein